MGKIDLPSTPVPTATKSMPSSTVDVSPIKNVHVEGQTDKDYSIDLLTFKKSLDVPLDEYRFDNEAKWLLDWAKDKGLSREELLVKLKEMEYKKGLLDANDKIRRLYQAVKIEQQIKDLVVKSMYV